jgi:hypothetical protein
LPRARKLTGDWPANGCRQASRFSSITRRREAETLRRSDVELDVITDHAGAVSVRGALEDYGVVLDPATLEIDRQATDEARAARAGETPLIDRGPGFEDAEAAWRARLT